VEVDRRDQDVLQAGLELDKAPMPHPKEKKKRKSRGKRVAQQIRNFKDSKDPGERDKSAMLRWERSATGKKTEKERKRDFKSEFFERIQEFEVRDEEKDTDTWMSWREVINLDGEPLVLAQIAQGTMVRRPHPKLDPLHETTLAMPENERFQYKQGRNQEIHTNAEVNTTSRSSKEEPPENGKPCADDIENEKKILLGVKKVHNGVLASAIEVKIKLGKFQDNKNFMRVFNNSQCIPNY